jgi:hypothetical protein
MTNDQASTARNSVIAAIEKESKDKTGLRSDVVTLYQGGAYHLYRCKRYVDVRLVFAPEQQMAFFGGDPDNFEYPRYDLDICLFRVYENGQPAKIEDFLKWNLHGPSDGELTFVSGSPGKRIGSSLWMNWPTRAIAGCLIFCACLTGAKYSSWFTARAHSRMHARRATIFLATKTIGSVTMAILPGCLIPKFGPHSRHANKNYATQLGAIPS